MLALQINNQWAVLSEDQSVTIEENSPVWGEGNSFSLPFKLDVEANRHIFGNSDQLTGMSVYDVLEGQSATLYVMDIPLFYGKLSLEDEVEIENGTVEVSLISSRLAFDDMIEGMNCQDVELTEEIVLGEKWGDFTVNLYNIEDSEDGEIIGSITSTMPSLFMRMRDNGKSTVNTTYEYSDGYRYCNTRICYPLPETLQDDEKGPESKLKKYWEFNGTFKEVDHNAYMEHIDKIVKDKAVVLDAERPLSAPCFYVLFFLQCLFTQKGLSFDFSNLYKEEDIKRLAFMSTRCAYREEDSGWSEETYIPLMKDRFAGIPMVEGDTNYPMMFWRWQGSDKFSKMLLRMQATIQVKKCIATSENFPDTDVDDVLKSLENGFGVRFLFNRQQTKVTPVYVRDVLKGTEVKVIHSEIISVHKMENAMQGFRLKYSGDDKDTAYNYTDWDNPILITSYNSLLASVSAYDKKLYIDTETGNAYRIKIDGEATEDEEPNPSLFEVGAFNPVEYGECSNNERVEEILIPFTPLAPIDTASSDRRKVIRTSYRKGETVDDGKNNKQEFAALADVQMKYPSLRPVTKIGGYADVDRKRYSYELSFTYVDTQRYDEKRTDQSLAKIKENRKRIKNIKNHKEYEWEGHRSEFGTPTSKAYLDNESPIQTLDAGLTLGIMRGPGSDSSVQDYDEDYDGEGGFKYVPVPTNYAFHSDSIDNYAQVFDYDGGGNYTGVDTTGRFSLKLRAGKPEAGVTPSVGAGRGLYDKFYTEYAYFVTHCKIAKLTLRMEIADLVNIDWITRYHIGSFIGFINSYSYTVDSQGISEVQMELYYI